jgi:hypothetical protein
VIAESQRSPKRWKDTIRDLPRQMSFDFKGNNLTMNGDSNKMSHPDSPFASDTLKYKKNTPRLYKTVAERRRPREGLQFDVYNSTRRQAIKPHGVRTFKDILADENSFDV